MRLTVEIKKRFPGFTLETAFQSDSETLGLLGGSGSGKSMTLKCIVGIITPDEGHIELDGTVLFDSKRHINLSPQKRNVGYLFQNYALFPNMTVEQNIRCGNRTISRAALNDVLERFYLTELGKRYPAQISGGQQQRVALARMLVSEPAMLLLDEPFSALDSYLRGEMERELMDLLRVFDGPCLLVSHNRDEIYRLCNRVAVYHNGHLDVIGEKKQVFANPGTETAAVLTGCRNVLRALPVDDHKVKIPGWNTELYTELPVNDRTLAVGIRAHFFACVPSDGANVIACRMDSIIDSPFETTAYVRPEGGTDLLCWKADKDTVKRAAERERIYLYIAPQQVLTLTSHSENDTEGEKIC